MSPFREVRGGVEWRNSEQFVRVEMWGMNSVRVRSEVGRLPEDLPGALLDAPLPTPPPIVDAARGGGLTSRRGRPRGGDRHPGSRLAVMRHGGRPVEISPAGVIRFLRADGTELLSEQPAHFWWPGARHVGPLGSGRYRIEQTFASYDFERIYGLGQHQHGLLDQKGAVIDLLQRNTEVSIPFLLSNRGYGLLWNNPAVGVVELAVNATRWVAHEARQIGYWFTAADSPAQILGNYADATGHSPVMPQWATGFWQSKLRYRTEEELLDVAREYHRRGLPLSVIGADFFHWPALGDRTFENAGARTCNSR